MQNFQNVWGSRRRIDIRTMNIKDIEIYYNQFRQLSQIEKERKESELKNRIKEKEGKRELTDWILVIKDKNGKLIGKIEVFDLGNDKAFFSIEIPNRAWTLKYGTEAIDQFIKICVEQKLFKMIEFDSRNEIVNLYKKQHGEEDNNYINNNYIIEIKTA